MLDVLVKHLLVVPTGTPWLLNVLDRDLVLIDLLEMLRRLLVMGLTLKLLGLLSELLRGRLELLLRLSLKLLVLLVLLRIHTRRDPVLTFDDEERYRDAKGFHSPNKCHFFDLFAKVGKNQATCQTLSQNLVKQILPCRFVALGS